MDKYECKNVQPREIKTKVAVPPTSILKMHDPYVRDSPNISIDTSESAWPEIQRAKTPNGRLTPLSSTHSQGTNKLEMATIVDSLLLYEEEMNSRTDKIDKLDAEIMMLRSKLTNLTDQNTSLEAQSAEKDAQIRALETENQELRKKDECQICFKDSISRVLSCGHVLCQVCTKLFLPDKCPFCQQKPIGYQHVFLN